MIGLSTLRANFSESFAGLLSVLGRVGAGVSGTSTEVALSLIFLVRGFSLSDVADSVGLGVDTVRLGAGNLLSCDVVDQLGQGLELVIAGPAQHSLLDVTIDEAVDDHLLHHLVPVGHVLLAVRALDLHPAHVRSASEAGDEGSDRLVCLLDDVVEVGQVAALVDLDHGQILDPGEEFRDSAQGPAP